MFLVRTLPFPEESLSSWRQRCAVENGFLRYPRPPNTNSQRDPDRMPLEKELQWLENELRVSRHTIARCSLDHLGKNVTADFTATEKPRWVVPVGLRRMDGLGAPCCPRCLEEDATPYFRISWRFAFIVDCPVHGVGLIDCCPHCGKCLWPAVLRVADFKQWNGLAHCPACGGSLVGAEINSYQSELGAQDLLRCAVEGQIPRQLAQAAHPQEVFSGLWAMSQLLLRGNAFHLWENLPRTLSEAHVTSAIEDNPGAIELLPIELRRYVLRAAGWLLEQWPHRFVAVMGSAGVSKQHFPRANWKYQPPWFNDEIEKSLSRVVRGITTEQVREAIKSVEKSGASISKSAVKRVLGVTEAKAVNELITHRRTATVRELLKVCRKFEQRLATVPESRDQRTTLIRDYLIFLVSVLAGMQVEEICLISEAEVLDTLAATMPSNNVNATAFFVVTGRARQLNELYARDCRPHLTADAPNRYPWFVGRNGEKLAGHTVRERIAKLMRTGFPHELWNSSDVFVGVFTDSGHCANS